MVFFCLYADNHNVNGHVLFYLFVESHNKHRFVCLFVDIHNKFGHIFFSTDLLIVVKNAIFFAHLLTIIITIFLCLSINNHNKIRLRFLFLFVDYP